MDSQPGVTGLRRHRSGARRIARLIRGLVVPLASLFLCAAPLVAGTAGGAAAWATAPLLAQDTPQAQERPGAAADSIPVGADRLPVLTRARVPVFFRGDTVFHLDEPIGGFTAAERAEAVGRRLSQLAVLPTDDIQVQAEPRNGFTSLVVDEVIILSLTDADASVLGTTRAELADEYAGRLQRVLTDRAPGGLQGLVRGAVETLAAIAALLLVFLTLSWGFNRIYTAIERDGESWIPPLKVQRLELISAERMAKVLMGAARLIRITITVLAIVFFVPLVLSFFPATEAQADRMVEGMASWFWQLVFGVVNYVPRFLRIVAILVVTYYVLKLVHLIFDGLRTGRLRVRGFYPDWAEPTYQIVRFLVAVFALILIWPYLPGSESAGFRGVAAFVGLLITFGSASAIANIIGGIVLIYMRAFQIGDRVQISETTGDVIEKGLLVTRIRTPKNVNVTIPNSMVLGNHLINYSRAARREGVVLHTTVTIGYDVPWPDVHEALLKAARGTDGVLESPEPFVLQQRLDDFYVAYEINAYTREPNRMINIYSDLHRRIQDAFNEAGIEIMSPHFRAMRDGSNLQVPEAYVPDGFEPRSFPVSDGR